MNRRTFTAGTASVLAVGSLQRVTAQATPQATPEASDDIDIESFDGFVRSVTREFERADPSIADALSGAIINLLFAGAEFDTSEHASEALSYLASEYPAIIERALRADGSFTIEAFNVTDVSFGSLGDERLALHLEPTLSGVPFDTLSFAVCLVRKDRFLQFIVGYAITGAVATTIDIVEHLDERWPSDDLWSMVATLEDVPTGMAVTDEAELPE